MNELREIASMRAISLKRVAGLGALSLALFLACVFSLSAPAADEPTSELKFEIVGGNKELPVENASVYVKFAEERTLRRDKRVEWRAKTNRDGLAGIRYIPRGKVLIQIVAEGWKTFGKYYDLKEDVATIKIKLERPRRWY